MINAVEKYTTKESEEIITFSKLCITGYVDDLAKVLKELQTFIKNEVKREIRLTELESIFMEAVRRSNV